jgi:hypothetical protein
VIVEGKFDDVYLRAAIAASEVRPRWKLLAPSSMTGEDIGGDSVLPYLRFNRAVLSSRPDTAPIFVVRDWEAPDSDLAKYQAVLKYHAYSACLRPPAEIANPALDDSWVGIERYLTTERIKTILPVTSYGYESTLPNARYHISSRMLKKYKPTLAESVNSDPAVGEYMVGLLRWIDEQVTTALAGVPSSSFG